MTVVWRAEALADVVNVVQFISQQNPIAAQRVAGALRRAGDSLALFPRRGRAGRVLGTRELVAVVPYVIVYEVDPANRVAILNVWHGAQKRP